MLGPWSGEILINGKPSVILKDLNSNSVFAKTLFEFKSFNITLGLPFIRISPDHGPNTLMLGKNLSNPQSLLEALKFLDK